jgi:hypothetical protein
MALVDPHRKSRSVYCRRLLAVRKVSVLGSRGQTLLPLTCALQHETRGNPLYERFAALQPREGQVSASEPSLSSC